MTHSTFADPSLTDARRRLRERRDELMVRLRAVEDELDAPRDPDVGERAVERELDEVLEAEGRAGLKEIAAIDAALGRVEEGTYGTCMRCGEAILPARLEAVPHAALCRSCARR